MCTSHHSIDQADFALSLVVIYRYSILGRWNVVEPTCRVAIMNQASGRELFRLFSTGRRPSSPDFCDEHECVDMIWKVVEFSKEGCGRGEVRGSSNGRVSVGLR